MFALNLLKSLATKKTSVVLLVGVALLQAYMLVPSSEAPLDGPRGAAADRVAQDIAAELSAFGGEAWYDKYVHVARLQGDPNGHIRGRIEDTLQPATNCRLVSDTVATGIREDVAERAARLGAVSQATADEWKSPSIATAADAARLAKDADLDFVIYGRVVDFRDLGYDVVLSVELNVATPEADGPVYSRTFGEDDEQVFADGVPHARSARLKSIAMRVGGWLLFAFLLPIATGGFWVNLLENESPLVNGLCLALLTGIDALVAWALAGLSIDGLIPLAGIGLALVAGGTWNLFVLGMMERQRIERTFA